jgi:hypothetical protein
LRHRRHQLGPCSTAPPADVPRSCSASPPRPRCSAVEAAQVADRGVAALGRDALADVAQELVAALEAALVADRRAGGGDSHTSSRPRWRCDGELDREHHGGELDREALPDVADLGVAELEAVQLGTGATGAARRDRAGDDRGGGGGEISHPARHRRHRPGPAPVAAPPARPRARSGGENALVADRGGGSR